MSNAHIEQRLAGIQTILNGVHQGGRSLSSATKGGERAAFIDQFLSQVLPPSFRFGAGDITDLFGQRSGQIDVVVEYPLLPSLPIISAGQSRLYLAEGVAAAIEVKSDAASQWPEVVRTADLLLPLRRNFGGSITIGPGPLSRVPLFVIGYTGWKTLDSIASHLTHAAVDGVLIIDAGLFVAGRHFYGLRAEGPWALWGLIACLHQAVLSLQHTSANPHLYAAGAAFVATMNPMGVDSTSASLSAALRARVGSPPPGPSADSC